MKSLLRILLSLLIALAFSCAKADPVPDPKPDPDPPVSNLPTGVSYQLLVYSFADSDGDGIGDFNGIKSKLDYLKEMGVEALWLSPIHPASSYHGYDVTDYNTVNGQYGSESDFKSLITTAHEKNIKIYIDYVLNHTSKDHPWFLEAKNNTESEYRNWYFFSEKPYLEGTWTPYSQGYDGKSVKVRFTLVCDSADKPKTLTVDKVDEVKNTGTQTSGKYLWWGDPGQNTQFYTTGSKTYTLSIELKSPWGVLVRTSATQWDSYKYGAPAGNNQLQWGLPLTLSNSSNDDILMPGMKQMYYYSVFGSYMPDINYGPASTCEQSESFKALASSADKWIKMGVDGFRLDAVKHIYTDAKSDENPTFLKKFYEHCNASFKASGHSEDFYMVGEHFSEAAEVAPYYKGIPAFFEFSFWWRLCECLNDGNGSSFASTINNYHKQYEAVRKGAIAATKLTNHDEDRAASTLGRSSGKIRMAAAVLMTCGGEPYIYQGEELGYWGTKAKGDAYVRTPIMWTADGTGMADKALDGQIDKSMLTSSISVEKQSADENSILSIYRKFGKLRTQYKALGQGDLQPVSISNNNAVASWIRECDSQRVLVVHNFGPATVNITQTQYGLGNIIASSGTVNVSGTKLTLGSYSSALFLL